MKYFYLCLILTLISTKLSATVLNVGAGFTYSTLSDAAQAAEPGDTILVNNVVQDDTQWISELKGTSDNWIYIIATDLQEIVYSGNTEAWHLSDCEYISIYGFKFEGQTGNGVNIDDAGTFDTPSHHITIERCEWGLMNASANNDQLKLSGVDDIIIKDCNFHDGSVGGSMVDMVGCHDGQFYDNYFYKARANGRFEYCRKQLTECWNVQIISSGIILFTFRTLHQIRQ